MKGQATVAEATDTSRTTDQQEGRACSPPARATRTAVGPSSTRATSTTRKQQSCGVAGKNNRYKLETRKIQRDTAATAGRRCSREQQIQGVKQALKKIQRGKQARRGRDAAPPPERARAETESGMPGSPAGTGGLIKQEIYRWRAGDCTRPQRLKEQVIYRCGADRENP
jgi:hypothetical protein